MEQVAVRGGTTTSWDTARTLGNVAIRKSSNPMGSPSLKTSKINISSAGRRATEKTLEKNPQTLSRSLQIQEVISRSICDRGGGGGEGN